MAVGLAQLPLQCRQHALAFLVSPILWPKACYFPLHSSASSVHAFSWRGPTSGCILFGSCGGVVEVEASFLQGVQNPASPSRSQPSPSLRFFLPRLPLQAYGCSPASAQLAWALVYLAAL